MSASSGPYSLPGVTGATTGPYAGMAVPTAAEVQEAIEHLRRNVSGPDWLAVKVLIAGVERAALAAAATPAPPVDVAAQLDVLNALIGDMACGLEVGDNHDAELADYLIRLRAIARALTGEATP